MIKRLKKYLLGADTTWGEDGIVMVRFHEYGVLEKFWLRVKGKQPETQDGFDALIADVLRGWHDEDDAL